MSAYRVNHEDLAWIMGCRWHSWLAAPIWDPDTNWFWTKHDDSFAEPQDRDKQLEILDLIKKAQDNPEYWRRKYAQSRTKAYIFGRGLNNLQKRYDRLWKENFELRKWTVKHHWFQLKYWYWRNKWKLQTWFRNRRNKNGNDAA